MLLYFRQLTNKLMETESTRVKLLKVTIYLGERERKKEKEKRHFGMKN